MDLYLKRFIKIRKERLSNEIQLRFLQRLSRLLSNGYPLIEALDVIKWDKQLTTSATLITNALKNGSSIDQAFDKAAFHPTITAYLYFVRANGDIQGSIDKCLDMYEQRMKYTKKFQQIIRYPLILIFIFSLLLYFIKQYVLPSFEELFQTSTESSSMIAISIVLIDLLSSTVIVLSILLIVGIVIWRFARHKLTISKQINLYRALPIYRKFLKLQTSFLFATHFSTLLKTGMSFKEILIHMSEQNKLPIIAHYSTLITEELMRGLPIIPLLSEMSFLENQLSSIFQKNADVNALEKDLNVYAEFVTEEIQRKIMKIITFIQPLFFIVLASFIIFIYVTLMWPMFQLIQSI
ncbi:competence protein ComGB [Virgibacillus natechei]|uniref:Competence protein ComGB n=1 Tax=Virgibacillus natechei TaxID=1216297 RepID=A0ABS4IGM8_9BACI|nr:competence type IV pilus assembly protein ComGB [Virgibacillus natechei]MBP1969740.1 competence protein ComGB [Virgibacillus natechei]UZD11460.1 competence type IV pilus assembly protein ComGB [Virgibacillus natechei]